MKARDLRCDRAHGLVRTPHTAGGAAVVAMYAGLLLTLTASLAPYLDRATGHVLADHIRHGYPMYNPDRVESAVTAWLALLTASGVLGIAGWTGTIWAAKGRTAWAPPTATVMFVAGSGSALTALLTKDTSGEVGLAPLLGWIGMLPLLPGLVAVVMLWAASGGNEHGDG